jgi:4-hydroxymandelate oxidase
MNASPSAWSSQGYVNLADHEQQAQTRLPPSAWAYVQGGAADEHTLRANTCAWQDISLWPRVLKTSPQTHTRIKLLEREWPTPLLIAPMANQALVHPHGEVGTTLAAAAQGVGMVLSAQANHTIEDVARSALSDPGRGPLWFQLYPMANREHLLDLMRRAHGAGYEALVLTVDAPVQGTRDRERRHPTDCLPHVQAVNLMPYGTNATGSWAQCLIEAPQWSDVQWIIEHAPLPVLLKGITHPEDAKLAVSSGAQGVIVSNHGGRVLDGMPATAEALPEVLHAVAGAIPVLVDGGIRRGTDVLKAMVMGASGVLLGRPVLHGLANGGAAGVAHVLRLLLDELQMAMALTGSPTLGCQPDLCRYTQR